MDIYSNIFTKHGPMNVKFPNNTSKWQMEFNSEFKGLNMLTILLLYLKPTHALILKTHFHIHIY
jgi:hypothetical protein